MKLEDAAEQEARQEFDRRVEREMGAGSKNYSLAEAAERVLRRDPNMAMPYADATDQGALAQRVGEVMNAAKKAAGASQYFIAGCRSSNLGRTASSSAKDRRRLDRSLGGCSNQQSQLGGDQATAYPVALRIVTRTYPEVDQDVANRASVRAGDANGFLPVV